MTNSVKIALDATIEEKIAFISTDEKFASAQLMVKQFGADLKALSEDQINQMITNERGWMPRTLANELIAYDCRIEISENGKSMNGFVKEQLESMDIKVNKDQKYSRLTLTLSTFAIDGVDFSNLANHLIQMWVDEVDIVCKASTTGDNSKAPTTASFSKNIGKHWELVKNSTAE
jgi:hypothetical protein